MEKRMYSLNLYNISPIQAGIQAYHSGIELLTKTINIDIIDKNYLDWALNHKTVILLNGGTTDTLKEYLKYIKFLGIECAGFYEPDLNNALTSISFILEENLYQSVDFDDIFVNSIRQRLTMNNFKPIEMALNNFVISDQNKDVFEFTSNVLNLSEEKRKLITFSIFINKFFLSNN